MTLLPKKALVAGAITLIGAFAVLLAGTPAQAATLKVGAALIPHSEILEFVKATLKKEGVDLQVIVLDDESQLNPALADKSIDANYFSMFPTSMPCPGKRATASLWPVRSTWSPSASIPPGSSPRAS